MLEIDLIFFLSELDITKRVVIEDMIKLSGPARKLSRHLCNPENYKNQKIMIIMTIGCNIIFRTGNRYVSHKTLLTYIWL